MAEYPESPRTELHEGDDHVDHPDAACSDPAVAVVAESVAASCATSQSALRIVAANLEVVPEVGVGHFGSAAGSYPPQGDGECSSSAFEEQVISHNS